MRYIKDDVLKSCGVKLRGTKSYFGMGGQRA